MAKSNEKVKICLYAICKNESKNVDAWMDYAQEADFIFILDTGSEDDTLEKLENWSELIEDGKFKFAKHDFSTSERGFRFDDARNMSIEDAEDFFPEVDVFLTTDLDERLEPGWADLIRDNWVVGQHQRISYSWANRGAAVLSSRNWGHARGWRWKYPCHEVMIRGYDGEIWYYPNEKCNLDEKLIVWHEKDHGKSRAFYLDVLKVRAREYDDVPSWAYLVREYSYRQMWEKILEYEDDVRRVIDGKDGNESMTCCVYIAMAHSFLRHDPKIADEWYERALECDTHFRFAWFEYAMHKDRQKDHKKALELLERGLAESERTVHVIFVDQTDMWTWRYLDWTGVEAFWSGDLPKALGYFAKALEVADEGHPQAHVWNNIAQCLEKHYREVNNG